MSLDLNGTTIDLRLIAPRERHPLIFSTFRGLPLSKTMTLVNDHDPRPLYYQMQAQHPGEFSWDYIQNGPEVWQVRIERTATPQAHGMCCGSCGGA